MKKINLFLISFAFLLTSFLFVSQVEASSFKNAEKIHISENEIVVGNLYASAIDIIVDGKIGGDLIAFAQNITVNGEIAGDLIIIASELEVNGRVEGNIRSLTNNFKFNGFVGRNVNSLGEEIISGKDSFIAWDLLSLNNKANLKGKINGNLDSSSQNITLAALIEKDANIKINNKENGFYLSPEANIEGNLNYFKNQELNLEGAENVKGEIIFNKIDESNSNQLMLLTIFFKIIGALLVALVLVFGFKKITSGILKSIPTFSNKDLIFSFLFLLLSPFIAIIFFMTVVGIPFSLLLMAIYLVAIYLSKVLFGIFVGDLIFKKTKTNNNYFLFVSLGVLLSFIAFNLPFVGSFISILIVLFTLSSIIKYARN